MVIKVNPLCLHGQVAWEVPEGGDFPITPSLSTPVFFPYLNEIDLFETTVTFYYLETNSQKNCLNESHTDVNA